MQLKYKEADDIFFFQSLKNDNELDWVTFNKDIESERRVMKKYYDAYSELGFFVVKTPDIDITNNIQKLVKSNEYIDLRS